MFIFRLECTVTSLSVPEISEILTLINTTKQHAMYLFTFEIVPCSVWQYCSTRCGPVYWDTSLQTGKTRVRFWLWIIHLSELFIYPNYSFIFLCQFLCYYLHNSCECTILKLCKILSVVIFVMHRVLMGKPEGKRPLGRPRRRWEDNIKRDFQKVGGDCGNWMERAQDRDRWRTLVNTVMNFRVP
jgi:hypothetical protein